MKEEHQALRLSDAFMAPSDKLELIVNVYNLADGMNEGLKERCRPLNEYSIFSNHYKQLRKQRLPIDEAGSATIRYCIDNNVMKDYLQHNESELTYSPWLKPGDSGIITNLACLNSRSYEFSPQWTMPCPH